MEQETLQLIKMYLKIPGNTPAKLASELGYRTSNTINHWLRHGTVPMNKTKEIRRLCEKVCA